MPRTADLPGVEGEGVAPKRIKALDNACGKWRAVVAQRQSLTEEEVKARDKVLSLMHEHGVTKYHYYDDDDEKKLLCIEANEKVKLKAIKDEAESEADETDANDE
jgi:hypothetical protein